MPQLVLFSRGWLKCPYGRGTKTVEKYHPPILRQGNETDAGMAALAELFLCRTSAWPSIDPSTLLNRAPVARPWEADFAPLRQVLERIRHANPTSTGIPDLCR